MRLLMGMAAQKPSGRGLADVNPFVTPFDDEHWVRIEVPARVASPSPGGDGNCLESREGISVGTLLAVELSVGASCGAWE
jgi:hypothetical protein